MAGGWKQEKDFGEVRDSYSNFQFGKDKSLVCVLKDG